MSTVILDSSFLVALWFVKDVHAQKAEKLLEAFSDKNSSFVVNQYLLVETATVLLQKTKSSAIARDFFTEMNSGLFVEVIKLEKSDTDAVDQLFVSQKPYKGEYLSWFDCSVIALANQYDSPIILTFDKAFAQFKTQVEILGLD